MTHKYETALRKAVQELYKQDPSDVTVQRARAGAEKKLSLDEGFFKNDEKWKSRSKDVVNDEFVCLASSMVVTTVILGHDEEKRGVLATRIPYHLTSIIIANTRSSKQPARANIKPSRQTHK